MTPNPTPVTVVVPVYRNLDDVRGCLDSVLRHAGGSVFDLLVIDDSSPEPAVSRYLDGFRSDLPTVASTVLRNDENLGFVKTCGRALRETSGDVVLLNSDTLVTEGWLDRLTATAQRPDVATVTPLTNFGSICTLPAPVIEAFALAGPAPRVDECAVFVRQHSLHHQPEVITGVGFCMYITRAALDTCGALDEDTFGAGYGEEVDFCLRASGHGFVHLVEDATFVYHRGGGSFNERRAEGLKASSEIIHRRYPFFRTMNRREREEDPLRLPFAALELGLQDRRTDRRHVLQMLHSRPGELGGTEKHFWRLMHGLSDGFDLAIFQPCEEGFLLSTLWKSDDGAPIRHEFLIPGGAGRAFDVDDPAAAAALEMVLDMFDFDAVHIQNIVHHSLAPLAVLAEFEGPVACSVRDLYLACPHHWLLYRNQQSCGIPEDLSLCARCLPETRNLDLRFLETFRETVAERLETVDHWVFASQSAVDFFLRVYDVAPDRVEVIEHGAIIDLGSGRRTVDAARVLDEPLRIAFVGIGWAKKGLPIVNELAESLAGTGIELHHFGELRDPISPCIHEHGRYDNNVLPQLLHRAGIQIVLLPGPFVETFGHVMTEALIAGLPIIGSRHGALGERIRKHEVGWTIDSEDVAGIRTLIDNLDRCRPEVLRATRRAAEVELRSVGATVERYASLYRSDDRTGGVSGTLERAAGEDVPMGEKERLQRELRAMATMNRRLQTQLNEAKRTAKPTKPARTAARTSPAAQAAPVAPNARSVGWTGSARSMVRRARKAIATRGVLGSGVEAGRRASRRLGRSIGR